MLDLDNHDCKMSQESGCDCQKYLTCPECGHKTRQEEWTNTLPDNNGDAKEEVGLSFYCTNEACKYHLEAIEC